ncbi:MAG: hypothetical protein U9Q38_07545 [Thermodesulfobacteriota bacterium]|nr:hypothetical protein [Thermodesulfobacteriota bacterium]
MNLDAKTAAIFLNIYALRAVTKIRRLVPSAVTKNPTYLCLHFPPQVPAVPAREQTEHHYLRVHPQAVFHEPDHSSRVLLRELNGKTKGSLKIANLFLNEP